MTVQINIAMHIKGFPGGAVVKNPPANAGDLGLIPGLRRLTGGGHGNPPAFLPGENHGQRSLESIES